MLIKPATVVVNFAQRMVDEGFIKFDWVPEPYQLRLPEGQEFVDEESSQPPKAGKERPKPTPRVETTKKVVGAGAEDVQMAEVEQFPPKRLVKRTPKARQLAEKEDEDDLPPKPAPHYSQGSISTRSSGVRGTSSSKRTVVTASHVEVPAKRSIPATSSTAVLPTVNLEPERPKLDLSGYSFEEGTTVQELWIPNVKTPVSVSSQQSEGPSLLTQPTVRVLRLWEPLGTLQASVASEDEGRAGCLQHMLQVAEEVYVYDSQVISGHFGLADDHSEGRGGYSAEETPDADQDSADGRSSGDDDSKHLQT